MEESNTAIWQDASKVGSDDTVLEVVDRTCTILPHGPQGEQAHQGPLVCYVRHTGFLCLATVFVQELTHQGPFTQLIHSSTFFQHRQLFFNLEASGAGAEQRGAVSNESGEEGQN